MSLRKLGRPAEALKILDDFEMPATAVNNKVHYLRQACYQELGSFAKAAETSASLLELDATFRVADTVPGPLQSCVNAKRKEYVLGIDARFFGNHARFANHYEGIALSHNANIVVNRQEDVICYEDPFLALQSRRDILAGQEILVWSTWRGSVLS